MMIKFSCFVFIAIFQVFLVGIYISIIRINSISGSLSTKAQFTSGNKGNREDESPKEFVKVATDIFVYSAYLDDRQDRFVRMVGIIVDEMYRKPGELTCNMAGTRVKAAFYKSRESHSLEYAAVLISCEIPVTVTVDLLAKQGLLLEGYISQLVPTETRINVKVPHRKEPRIVDVEIGVCVPPLFGSIAPLKIIEFIEVTKILGASQVIFYNYDISDSLRRVLDLYIDIGDVTVKQWKHNFTKSELWYYGQSASIWDCLLSNMYKYDYLAFNDIDEFIVPREVDTWQKMIKSILYSKNFSARTIAAFEFNSYMFKASSSDIRLQNKNELQLATITSSIRTEISDAMRSKIIVNPRKVFELQIHRLGQGLAPDDQAVRIPDTIASVHHYRHQEGSEDFKVIRRRGEVLPSYVVDETMAKYQESIVQGVKNIKERFDKI